MQKRQTLFIDQVKVQVHVCTNRALSFAAKENQSGTIAPDVGKHQCESERVIFCNLVHFSEVYNFIPTLGIGLMERWNKLFPLIIDVFIHFYIEFFDICADLRN